MSRKICAISQFLKTDLFMLLNEKYLLLLYFYDHSCTGVDWCHGRIYFGLEVYTLYKKWSKRLVFFFKPFYGPEESVGEEL